MSEIQKLTVKEAIEQGYTLCGFEGEGFQHLHRIEELNPVDFDDFMNRVIVLADKDPMYLSVNAKDLHERISEELMDSSDFRDDTDEIPDAVKEAVNWEDIAEKINQALRGRPYHYLTQIRLVP